MYDFDAMTTRDKTIIKNLVKREMILTRKTLTEYIYNESVSLLRMLKDTNQINSTINCLLVEEEFEIVESKAIDNYIRLLNLIYKISGEKPEGEELKYFGDINKYYNIDEKKYIFL